MTSPLRSAGWSVRPSFVAHGPTSPVTLLADDVALTQLAGIPDVAWQTPWTELSALQLVRARRAMALFATADGVRYCWRAKQLDDFEAWREVVLTHGGTVTRRARRFGVLSVITVVLLASFAGGIASFVTGSTANHELAAAQSVNLTLKDLPVGWSAFAPSTPSALSYIFPPGDQIFTSSTTTTAAPAHSLWSIVSSQFQHCLGVSAARDRLYGAAGQSPDDQVSSPIFGAPSFDGIQVATTTQYYATTSMVQRDQREMARPGFGACFVASNATLVLSANSGRTVRASAGTAWRPRTFTPGFSRGGVVALDQLGVRSPLHLVMAEIVAGHYEVTFGALVTSWPRSAPFLANLVNTLLARITTTTSAAV